ncbi:MAG: hypothetical protein L6Q99_00185 [Planctomycetes bacterium]|nr:hypothetical protein [Planctomycetota bacterium]
MLRSSLVASAVAVLCAAASAQQVNLSRIQPITVPVKHAGVFNLKTGKFNTAAHSAQTAVLQNIYRNDCTWAGGAFYVGAAACEDDYDEGRIPNGGVGADHNMKSWEIAYCTAATTGTADIDWEMFDTQAALGGGGACTFGGAGTPPPFTAGLVGFDSSAAGFPLPGATQVGGVSCWIVGFSGGTGQVCVTSSANSADQFVWRFRQNNNLATASGPILSGEPSIPGGAGTFAIPAGTDPIFGTPCGHGLDSQDLDWINTDNTPAGGVPPAGCVGALSTGCYWFGGYPTNPFAGYWFRVEGDGNCAGCTGNVTPYCTAKVNSLGCTPTVASSGIPNVANCAGPAFNLTVANLVGNKNGLWFYGTNGLNGVAFQGGHLCIKPAIKRLSVQASGGQGTACNGTYTTNFNARICSGSDAALVAGALVGAQAWTRDPNSPSTTSLSSAISFTICP